MVFLFSMDLTEDNSVYKHYPVQMINFVLQDSAVKCSLFSLITDSQSVLIGHFDLIRSCYRTFQTSHGMTSLYFSHFVQIIIHSLIARVNDLMHGPRLNSVPGSGLRYEDDGQLLVDTDLGGGKTNSAQFVEQ